MAVRVNKRFVLILLAAVALVFGGVTAWYFAFLRTTPEQNRRQAEQFADQGEYNRALRYIGKAVHERREDVQLLYRYIELLEVAEVDDPAAARDRIQRIVDTYRTASEARPADPDILANLYRHLFDLATRESMGSSYLTWLEDLVRLKISTDPPAPVADVARRFRGIAVAHRLTPDASGSEREEARADLAHALETDPDDHLANHYLARWQLVEAERLEQAGDDQQRIEELRRSAAQRSAATVDPRFTDQRLERLLLHARLLGQADLAAAETDADADAETENEADASRAAAVAELTDHLLEHGEPRWLFAPVAQQLVEVDLGTGERVATSEQMAAGMDRAVALLRRGGEAFPHDITMHFTRAGILRALGRVEPALAAYRLAADVPERGPALMVARADRLRIPARLAVGNLMLASAGRTEDPEARDAILAEVEQLIERIKLVQPNAAPINLLEGKLLMARGDTERALVRFDRASQQYEHRNADALRLLAAASQQLGQWGNARRQLERLVELRPGSASLRLSLAEALLRTRELDAAEQHAAAAADLQPDHPGLPIVQARLAAARGELDRAVAILEARVAADAADDAHSELLIELYRRTGREGDARALAAEQFDRDPADLRRLRAALGTAEDDAQREAMLDRAERAGVSASALELLRDGLLGSGDRSVERITEQAIARIDDPLDRRLAEARLHAARGEAEAARQAVEEVLAERPESTDAIELAFRLALEREDYDEAQRLADRAAELDVDLARGLFFRGRLAAARGDWERAVVAFESALDLRPVYAEGWTLLGRAHYRAEAYSPAIRALERAVEQKPDSVDAWVLLGRAHALRDQPDRALDAFASAYRFAPQNEQVFRLYAAYLARQGRTQRAIELRRLRAQRRPEDAANRRTLAALLAASGDGDAALAEMRSLIDELGPSLENAATLARLHARLGDPERGLAVLEQRIERLGEAAEAGDYRALARYLAAMGRTDEADERYRAADRAAGEGHSEIKREWADVLFERGRMEEAVEMYRAIHAAEPDDATVRLRLAEALIRLDRDDRARELLAEAPPRAEALVLRAMLARRGGDAAAARGLLDRAVETAPDHREARLMRARLALADGDADRAIDDLIDIVEDNPDDAASRRLLAEVRARRGETAAAIRDFQTLLENDPRDASVRAALMELLRRAGRTEAALDVAREGMRMDGDEVRWARGVGRLAASLGRLELASEGWRRVMEGDPTASDALTFVSVLLSMREPAEALSVVESHPGLLQRSPRLQALRAEALRAVGNDAAAEQVMLRALERSEELSSLGFVATRAARMLGVDRTIEQLKTRSASSGAGLRALVAQLAAQHGRYDEAVAEYEAALAALPADAVSARLPILAQLAAATHQTGNHELAAERYRAFLEAQPESPQVLNNYAFLVAHDLDRPAEALPHAQRAVELAPRDANILDTLGWVEHLAGDSERAARTLRRSIDMQPLPANHYHLGRVRASLGDVDRARRLLHRSVEMARAARDGALAERALAAIESLPQPEPTD